MSLRGRLAVGFVAASWVWTAALVAVPFASARWPAAPSVRVPSASVYLVGGFLCHQRADRSFHPWGVRMPVCARCFGLYASAAAGAAVALLPAGLARPRRVTARAVRRVLVVAALPTAMIWFVEWSGLAAPSGLVRAGLAIPLGAVVGWIVTTAIVREIE